MNARTLLGPAPMRLRPDHELDLESAELRAMQLLDAIQSDHAELARLAAAYPELGLKVLWLNTAGNAVACLRGCLEGHHV